MYMCVCMYVHTTHTAYTCTNTYVCMAQVRTYVKVRSSLAREAGTSPHPLCVETCRARRIRERLLPPYRGVY